MDSGDAFLISRVKDCAAQCERKNIPVFFGFLNETELSVCVSYLIANFIKHSICGGYENAGRKMVAFLPDFAEECEFPYRIFEFRYKTEFELSHRDFLGTFMSLGVERSKIGDILVESGRTVAFVHSDVAEFCIREIEKVGGVGVKIRTLISWDFDYTPKFEEVRKTVPSPRLDCVVAALCNTSRSKASGLINRGSVFVNQTESKDNSLRINNGDYLTIRGFAKFVVDNLCEKTKKQRLILQCRKYI